MTRYLFIFIVLYAVPALADPGAGIPPAALRGVVIDAPSGRGIRNAVISLEKNGEVIHSVRSDAEGKFTLTWEGPFRNDSFRMHISKEGYQLLKVMPYTCEDPVEFRLEKKVRFEPFILRSGSRPSLFI